MGLRFPPHGEPATRPVIITGASSGIGRVSAVELAALGHPTVVGARRADRLDELVAEIREAGGEATACVVDVTSLDSVRSFVASAAEVYGPPDVLVSSAGVLKVARIWEMDPSDFAEQVDIHLLAVHRLLHAVIPGMIERRCGTIVLIGSDTSYTARPRSGSYAAAKAGVDILARQTQRELEGTGIRLGVVRPGPVRTEMGTDMDAETAEALIGDWVKHGFARHPRMCKPSDLARGVVAMVTMPRGAQIIELEIQPEAPIEEDFS